MIVHRDHSEYYSPPRRALPFSELVDVLETSFAAHGVPRARPLPLRWGRDTDLTVSAVQALDPLIKDGRDWVYRSGFLPQPVVRLTGQRDDGGQLRDGFLTSFVNISHIQPIRRHDEFSEVIDIWLSVLARVGLHARHLSLFGRLTTWQRASVRGVTLRFRHLDLTLGDVNLLWNADQPHRMAVDLGSGLERLAWARSRANWNDLVFGPFADAAPPATLDAIRTATLLLGHGIRPGPRGAGGTTRRMIGTISPESAPLGVDAMVRFSHRYWHSIAPLRLEWPATASAIEDERSRH
ncbi:hypothetical protein ACFTSF_32385 [Kribbella sp. NPDC056951]|uniref:hypothetical protein n=1 Tax=Kribbella sp. NPDC056951 TaxID=3345978 RepID=UPI00363DC5CE